MGIGTALSKLFSLPKLMRYSGEAETFWKESKANLIDELYDILINKPRQDVRGITKRYADRLSLPQLDCDESEIGKFYEIMKTHGEKNFVASIVDSGSKTDLIKELTVPALIAIDGMEIARKDGENCLATLCYLSLSSDMGDGVLDNEVPRPLNSSIPYEKWVSGYKIVAAGAFNISESRLKTMDEKIQERVGRGLAKVTLAEELDLKYSREREVPINVLDEIYEGKIAEIQKTIFGSLNILGGNRYPTLEAGAGYLADEAQILDDYEDLLGEDNKEPIIPNPSYFLTYCRIEWKKKPRNIVNKLEQELVETMKDASIDTKTKAMEFHAKVEGEYEKLNEGFKTKPFIAFIVEEVNKKVSRAHETFATGGDKTFGPLIPQIKKLVLTE
ncbi:MAG TPA: hypothetical protein VJ343_01165 [archaeon]|nr:hypothetical protein [archaeon]